MDQNHFMKRYASVRIVTLLACTLSWSVCLSAFSSQDQVPDLILFQGKVITVDAKDSVAEAIAIRNGKIVKVGSNGEILRMATHITKVIDLHGATVTPGLIDSHGHFADGGIQEIYHVDLRSVTTIAEAVALVAKKIATLKPGEWLEGDGWDEGKLAESRYIRAADLDPVSPDNPVWLLHTTGHYGVANSYALRMAHVDSHSTNPAAGTIDRDEHGLPTGVLKESAMDAVARLVPTPTAEQERQGILRILEELHREGVTSVKDADIYQHTWDAYKQLLVEGKLTERVCVLWHAGSDMDSATKTLAILSSLPKPPASLGDGRLISCGAKLYMDGSGGARTAWLYDDWNKNLKDTDTGNHGYPITDPAVYRNEVRLFHDAGFNVGTHAIGDHAIDWVVDTYAQVLRDKPTPGLRHSIIHANIPSDHAIQSMAEMQSRYDAGYPESQAPFIWWIGDTYAGNFGPVRSLRLNPFATYVRSHVQWGGGSDFFVTPFAPRFGLWASVQRETLKGVYGLHPFGTAESVDIHIALRSYTIWAARQLFLEKKAGSLEPGKAADIAVWDGDLYTLSSNELKNLKCKMTLLDGGVVYTDGSLIVK